MSKISSEAIKVLENCRIEGNQLFLPPGQLERKLYIEINTLLQNIKGQWNRKLKSHVFDQDPTEYIDNIILTGDYVDFKKKYQFFETPVEIVKLMIDLAELKPTDSVLESSAGQGKIADEVSKITKNIILFELMEENCKILEQKGYKVNHGDFLSFRAMPGFLNVNKAIINPPFSKGQDIAHIDYTFSHLNPSGTLVAICSESVFFRTQKKYIDFKKNILDKHMVENIKLEPGAFSSSGTNVSTRVIKLVKN